jgi:hypothetical protein
VLDCASHDRALEIARRLIEAIGDAVEVNQAARYTDTDWAAPSRSGWLTVPYEGWHCWTNFPKTR